MEIVQKLKQLEENVKILRELKNDISLESLYNDKRIEWELRYGIFESIQMLIDICCKITSHYNLGNPQNYKECIELLGKFGYIKKENISKYISMIGLRNLLVHEYANIEVEKLYRYLDFVNDIKSGL